MITAHEAAQTRRIYRIVRSYRRDQPTVILGSGADDGTLADFDEFNWDGEPVWSGP